MAYEVGSFLAELKEEHDGKEHKDQLHPQCPDCDRVSSRLEKDCLELRKHDGKPHPLCWVCNMEKDNEEIRADEKGALYSRTTEEWDNERDARRRASQRKGE